MAAFKVGPLGFYEVNKMRVGLTNDPATYQRLHEQSLGEYILRYAILIVIISYIYKKKPLKTMYIDLYKYRLSRIFSEDSLQFRHY